MKLTETLWLCAGIGIGLAVTLYEAETPDMSACQVYRVAAKQVTAYVLKPPPSPVIYKACPQVTERAENVSEQEVAKADESKPPRKRRHHRVRRVWR